MTIIVAKNPELFLMGFFTAVLLISFCFLFIGRKTGCECKCVRAKNKQPDFEE